MKRTLAVVALLASLGVLLKLAVKPGARPSPPTTASAVDAPDRPGAAVAIEAEALRSKYASAPAADRELAERTLDRYRGTAVRVERTDGLRGLKLLDKLDLEAIYLYEQCPADFRRLREALDDDAAADILYHWREYFGLKRADETDRKILIAEIARLSPSQRRAAARYPAMLPLILADPKGMTDLIARWDDRPDQLRDALVILQFLSLEEGPTDLRAALRTLDEHGELAVDAFRLQGLDGFALVHRFGPVLAALGDSPPLDQALIVLRVNADDVAERLRTATPEALAEDVRHAAAAGLVEAVGGSPHGLRLAAEYGPRGDRALALAGSDAAVVVYDDYSDPVLRRQAVESLAEHGPMALALLSKYAADPDFREVLRRYGPAALPPIAQADAGPEVLAYLREKPDRSFQESLAFGISYLSRDSGQAMIRLIKKDGLERVAALGSTDVAYYQFLPLYDLAHLGGVVGRGQSPTGGEVSWALMDACFVVADVLSLAALQPEGVAASELARAELKAVARTTARGLGNELAEETAEVAAEALAKRAAAAAADRGARWWAVRRAGGTYRVLGRVPEALPKLSIPEVANLGRRLCDQAGLRLSTWAPRFVTRNGKLLPLSIPPGRGLKYLSTQALQAGVGVVGFHKMEEHLAARRPPSPVAP